MLELCVGNTVGNASKWEFGDDGLNYASVTRVPSPEYIALVSLII
jgi:hypothetical protein